MLVAATSESLSTVNFSLTGKEEIASIHTVFNVLSVVVDIHMYIM
jgi:hypothetical protein